MGSPKARAAGKPGDRDSERGRSRWAIGLEIAEVVGIAAALVLGVTGYLRDSRQEERTEKLEARTRSNEIATLEGRFWASSADLDAVATAVDRLLRDSYPDDPRLLTLKGLIELHFQRYNDAEQSFKTALDKEQDNFHALIGLGKTLLVENQPDSAIGYLNKARNLSFNERRLVSDAGRQIVLLLLAAAYIESRDLGQAHQLLEEAEDLDPSNPYLYKLRGNLCRQEGNYGCAVNSYQKALDLDPANSSIRKSLTEAALMNAQLSGQSGEPATQRSAQ